MRIALALAFLAACSDDGPGFVAPDGYPGTFDAAWTCRATAGPPDCLPRAPYGTRLRAVTIHEDATIEWLNGPTDQAEPAHGDDLIVPPDEDTERSEMAIKLSDDRRSGSILVGWSLTEARGCLCGVALTRVAE